MSKRAIPSDGISREVLYQYYSLHRGKPPRRFVKYLRAAEIHPWHVVCLAGALVFGAATASLSVLISTFASLEVLLFSIIFIPAFRRWVDAQESQEIEVKLRIAEQDCEYVRWQMRVEEKEEILEWDVRLSKHLAKNI